ncbi:MAG: GTP-binding protein, partial [Pseudanabaena sp.]
AQRQEDPNLDHETPIEELFEDQLACADLVVLTKTDLVDAEAQAKVQSWLKQELRDGVKVVACDEGKISSEILLGFNAAVEDNLDTRPSHHDTEEEHEHDDDINSINIVTDRAFEPTQLLTSLKQAIADQEIYRIKGFVNVPNKPMRMVLQGVGDRLETSYDRLWASDEPRQTRLVFIGQALERSQIESALSL